MIAGALSYLQLGVGVDVYIAWMGAEGSATQAAAIRLARKIRNAGFSVEVPPQPMKMGKSLGLADKLGARHALIIGENEVASGRFALKHLATGEQRELDSLNLFDPACKVDFIITVEALKEGWDCSFAYVLCSVANIGSATCGCPEGRGCLHSTAPVPSSYPTTLAAWIFTQCSTPSSVNKVGEL